MAYNWGDLEEFRDARDIIEVEWGSNIQPNRRARDLQDQKRNSCISYVVMSLSLIAAASMVVLVSLSLMKAPKSEVGSSKSVGLTTSQTPAPSMKPSSKSIHSSSPTLEQSESPSNTASQNPSTSPSKAATEFPIAAPTPPPTPIPPCIDQIGFFYNHAGDKVSCDWFQSVGFYNYQRNCGQTDVGNACLLTCSQYVDCVVPTNPPTYAPTFPETSQSPTSSPTQEPPRMITIYPTGDAMIQQSSPQTNYGSANRLKIDTNSDVSHSLLRFELSKENSNRTVASAMLRLKAKSDCSSGGYLERTHHPHWRETSITWNTAPDGDGHEVSRFTDPIITGFWYTTEIKSALRRGHTALSLRLYPTSAEECTFASKESGSGESPELRIVFA